MIVCETCGTELCEHGRGLAAEKGYQEGYAHAEFVLGNAGKCVATTSVISDDLLGCTLRAGHVGMHHDLSGADWIGMKPAEESALVEECERLGAALREIANRCNCVGTCDYADDPSCIARRALVR